MVDRIIIDDITGLPYDIHEAIVGQPNGFAQD